MFHHRLQSFTSLSQRFPMRFQNGGNLMGAAALGQVGSCCKSLAQHIFFSHLAAASYGHSQGTGCLRAGCEASACLRRHPRGSNRNDPSAAPAFGQDFYVNQLFRSHIALYLPKIDHTASKPKKLHTLGPLERPARPAEQLLWCQPWWHGDTMRPVCQLLQPPDL